MRNEVDANVMLVQARDLSELMKGMTETILLMYRKENGCAKYFILYLYFPELSENLFYLCKVTQFGYFVMTALEN